MNHVSANYLVRRVRRLLGGAPSHLQVAALPWRRTRHGIEVVLVTSRDSGRWVLPKGWPKVGEELHVAAAREALEEAGLKGAVAPHETGRYFYEKSVFGSDSVHCEVLVFPLEVAGIADKWKEKGERRRKWFAPAKAAELVAEPDLGKLILGFAAGGQRAA